MSKLFKLKEWLTLDEAAAHISNVLGEAATVADLYRFSLDGHLKLSVDFVNHAHARKGKWVKTEDVEFELVESCPFTGEKLDIPYDRTTNNELHVSEDDWIYLEKLVVSIDGIWDLAMIGAERLDIEHNYQQLTSGPEVTLMNLEGAFVQQGDVICQLQESFYNKPFQTDSKTATKLYEQEFLNGDDSEEDIVQKIREKHLKKFLSGKLNDNDYFPAGGLPDDCVLVVRTKEITRFIQSLEDTPAQEKPLTSKERNSLLVLIGALCKEVEIDPNERGVAASLVAMTEILGAPLTDDTIRKILSQIENAIDLRSK
ncbi:MAG: hypothetical protein QNL04_10355 [SAR324 cluster bacterium]|nr:hypothetical protein [SAR324 cluster bacterium]